jgi:DNA (cytosine-5)-methyltransferase 1
MNENLPRPIAIDLFAGAGGFSLGAEQAGFDVAIAVEKDPVHALVHAFNFPHARVLCADVAELTGAQILQAAKEIKPEINAIDLVIGGPPCQGFSPMGKQDPKDDRNNLVLQFCRLVIELQPRYFVMENVPGLRLGKYKWLLRRVKQEFKQAGYRITEPVQMLNSLDFGVPQIRKRLFLLGRKQGEQNFPYPTPLTDPPTVRDAIADLPNLDRFPELFASDRLRLTPYRLKKLEKNASEYVRRLRGRGEDEADLAYPREWERRILTGFRRTRHQETSIARFQGTSPGQMEKISRFKRLHWEGYCCTLRAGTNAERGAHTSARPIHPQHPRVISVREAARLHSFPDWFHLHATKWHGFRQVGNSVPPLLARAVTREAIAAMELNPVKPQESLFLGDPQWLQWTCQKARQYLHVF